ncbi:MAG: ABC transporter substrate-binding protein [Blautia sp.]|nr:ABC transporter substrate-binding protein [Blautia sp.]
MPYIIWELLPEWSREKYTPDKEEIKEMIRLRKKRSILFISAAVFAAAVIAAVPVTAAETASGKNAPEFPGLVFESQMELEYAQCFDVFYYEGGYEFLDIHENGQYLLIPEDGQAPEGLDEDIIVLQKPLDHIYLVASAVMSLFDSMDALDHIRFSGTDVSGWYIENAAKAMETGEIVFAGKYSEPDYELLIGEECDLAIESTMVLHSPKVREMLEELGIPVFVDYSSYESHPLGRTEWIKLYGCLVDKEKEAKDFFDGQAEVVEKLKDFPNTEKTVAFFYVNTNGTVVVREATDYIPRMIEIAGGRYIFDDLKNEENNLSSVSLTMEEFYNQAIDADYLIYNATIDSPVETIDELLAKSELLADFKAVKEGNVWCTDKYMYQATDIIGNMITDIHLMLTEGDGSQMTFMKKIS